MEDFKVMHLGRVDIKNINEHNRREINSQRYSYVHLDYVNFTNMTMRVKGRFGIVHTIEPRTTPFNRDSYTMTDSRPGAGILLTTSIRWKDVDENLAELEKTRTTSMMSAELYKAIKDEYNRLIDDYDFHRTEDKYVSVSVMFIVHQEQLRDGYFYYPELDLTFGMFRYNEIAPSIPHPNTHDKRCDGTDLGVDYYYKGGHGDSSALTVSLQLVEEKPNTYTSRYIQILSETYNVPIVTSDGRPEGLYIKRNFTPRKFKEDGEVNTQIKYYDMKEAKDILGMSPTVEEAIHGGEFKYVLEKQKQNYEKEKQKGELELLSSKKELEELKDELAKEKLKLEAKERRLKSLVDKRKLLLDLRQRVRAVKDSNSRHVSSGLRDISLIFTGLASIVGSMMSLSKAAK